MKFYIVDAFTNTTFGGNPAGVVILDEGMDFPSDEICVKTAAELRYSETAFIKVLGDNEFQIRYFTPAAEVDLCGHATIGSFKVLFENGYVKDNTDSINHTLSGDLNISVKNGFILMDMAEPRLLQNIDDKKAIDELYSIMGLSYDEEVKKGLELKPQIITTGLPDIMMPVFDEKSLENIEPDFKALSELSERYEVTGVHAFTFNTNDATTHARNFAPLYDIDEEAATGTSSGAMTYYGYLNGLIKSGDDCRFVQGEKMGRPSEILSHIEVKEKNVSIRVGGSGVILASGEIMI